MVAIPTLYDRSFIPYIVGMDPQFDRILPLTEIQEGPVPWVSGLAPAKDFSNDAHDPGGATDEGVIQNEYTPFRRQWGLPVQSVKLMTKDEERTIYFVKYWMPHGPSLPPGLNLEFFDLDVNGGESRAVRTLQATLGIGVDGVWGTQTTDAVASIKNVDAAIQKFGAYRLAFYKSLSTYRYFGADWSRRTSEVETEAEAIEERAAGGNAPEV
jgi:lysozyme family protein